MPQNPLGPRPGGTASKLNIAAATLVKPTNGTIYRVSVTTAGAAGAIYDFGATTGQGAANLIAVIPATVGVTTLEFPCSVGILVVPGAAQVVSVSYD